MMQEFDEHSKCSDNLNVSFGYQCSDHQIGSCFGSMFELSNGIEIPGSNPKLRSSSFSCLSGAALSANATLANTNICNGLIGDAILPGLDSPKSFRKLASSPSLFRLDSLLSSSQSSMSTLAESLTDSDTLENTTSLQSCLSAPTRVESSSFLHALDAQTAGGAAGEDRVQAVCSEENGLLFCAIYDGFNGRDAADFLAVTLYDNILYYLHALERSLMQEEYQSISSNLKSFCEKSPSTSRSALSLALSACNPENQPVMLTNSSDGEYVCESIRVGVLNCLIHALSQAEKDFMYMVEQEMEDRPDLVSVGSSVLTALLHGKNLYVLNLGDSRAVLATANVCDNGPLQATQLSENHNVANEIEYNKLLADHPDDPFAIVGGRVKGKLKLTRAFGVGYLKKSKLNDALMGILRVRNLCSPPYIYTHPFTLSHRVAENDIFVILGSDGLFDFFANDEVVAVVHQFIQDNPSGDPAKHLIEQLVLRAAESAGFSTEELMSIPVGRRRKYHDDVTVIVIILGHKQQTSTASASL